MQASIKVLLVSAVYTAKNGNKYRKVMYLVTLDDQEFVETRLIWR